MVEQLECSHDPKSDAIGNLALPVGSPKEVKSKVRFQTNSNPPHPTPKSSAAVISLNGCEGGRRLQQDGVLQSSWFLCHWIKSFILSSTMWALACNGVSTLKEFMHICPSLVAIDEWQQAQGHDDRTSTRVAAVYGRFAFGQRQDCNSATVTVTELSFLGPALLTPHGEGARKGALHIIFLASPQLHNCTQRDCLTAVGTHPPAS